MVEGVAVLEAVGGGVTVSEAVWDMDSEDVSVALELPPLAPRDTLRDALRLVVFVPFRASATGSASVHQPPHVNRTQNQKIVLPLLETITLSRPVSNLANRSVK